jgi:site-specific DNA-methyltransferase (adenine-specific)
VQAGRAFIGSDLFYSELRAERIEKAVPDLVTPLTGVTAESMAIWAAEAKRIDHPAVPISKQEEEAQLEMTFGQDAAWTRRIMK